MFIESHVVFTIPIPPNHHKRSATSLHVPRRRRRSARRKNESSPATAMSPRGVLANDRRPEIP